MRYTRSILHTLKQRREIDNNDGNSLVWKQPQPINNPTTTPLPAISNCDPKKLGFNGGYNCSGEGMDFGCAFWCSPGVEFEFPAEDFYKCDYATGLWSPSPIPNCDYGEDEGGRG